MNKLNDIDSGEKGEKDICAFDETYVDSYFGKKCNLQIVWFNVYWYIVLHCLALYGLYLTFSTGLSTLIFTLFMYAISGLGITAGAHRLWSHRSYQAKTPLQILLAIFNTAAAQNSAIEWCRDHRVHHKYSETNADPHNALRGFFFAHMGWLMVRKHPEVKSKGKNISIKDLENNPILKFQKKYYLPLVILIGVIFPTFLPTLWGESAWRAFFVSGISRYVMVLHATWLVNSLAHLFGNKPYDQQINPAESLPVCILAIGEGFHNYHHTFPHDYSTSEFGVTLNVTTFFINCMAKIGWAYDLKKVSHKAVTSRKLRTGDGTKNIFLPIKTSKSNARLGEILEEEKEEKPVEEVTRGAEENDSSTTLRKRNINVGTIIVDNSQSNKEDQPEEMSNNIEKFKSVTDTPNLIETPNCLFAPGSMQKMTSALDFDISNMANVMKPLSPCVDLGQNLLEKFFSFNCNTSVNFNNHIGIQHRRSHSETGLSSFNHSIANKGDDCRSSLFLSRQRSINGFDMECMKGGTNNCFNFLKVGNG
ncbi:unnamed protein product [Gordionus sp. m RMFG-2023]|uniref:acyl-CoA desaturase-like n=1 Tax=Gordionus sp. m RMFG-2023 TaxID=3053472 RepID=UPI0030E1FD32